MALPETNESLIARFKNLPLEFKPGRKHAYSNSGYILLGVIIEKVSGESYENFLRRNIFALLEMNDTGVDRNEVALPNRAARYSLKDGKLANAAYQEMSQAGGAGVLYSTVEDLFRWNEGYFDQPLPQLAINWESSSAPSHFFLERTLARRRNTMIPQNFCASA